MASGTINYSIRVGKITGITGTVVSNQYTTPFPYYYGINNFSTTYGISPDKVISVRIKAAASTTWYRDYTYDRIDLCFGANVGSNWSADIYYELD